MKKLFTLLALGALATLWQGCSENHDDNVFPVQPGALSGDLANDWFALTIDLTKLTPGFSPPVAARAYGYTAVTLYEAAVGGMPRHNSLQGRINGLSAGMVPQADPELGYHWGLVTNRALAVVVAQLYKKASADQLARVGQLEQQYEQEYRADVLQDVFDNSKALGEAIGNAMYAYSVSDGQEMAYNTNIDSLYVPPVFPGCWVPTGSGLALQPHWGEVRPFLVEDITETAPPAPPAFSTTPGSEFYNQAKEVYDVSTALSADQLLIARFWSDDPTKSGTPPGHSISMLRQVLQMENADLELAAEAYARVGMAVHDAFIACWKTKFEYCLMRPVTYIRTEIDPNYTPVLNTPPFPEYTSGHSVQSGAWAQVMTDLFGASYTFTDRTHEQRTDIDGAPRTFNSFFEAADEAAISRLYGGIHYRAAIENGLKQGIEIGENISALPLKK
jgi:hypothetical protein